MEDGVNTVFKTRQSGFLAAFLEFLTRLFLLNKIIFASKWQDYLKDECKKENNGTHVITESRMLLEEDNTSFSSE